MRSSGRNEIYNEIMGWPPEMSEMKLDLFKGHCAAKVTVQHTRF